jgi:hypothetical protein
MQTDDLADAGYTAAKTLALRLGGGLVPREAMARSVAQLVAC